MIKNVQNKFDLGQTVYLKTDVRQYGRLVTAITIRQTGLVYELALSDDTSEHYDFEISDSEDIVLRQKNETED